MSRPPRLIVPGLPHHFTQRGNLGAQTFFDDDDYQTYLLWLAEYAETYGLAIWAYCLMPNHVHIVGVPDNPRAAGGVFRALQMRQAQRINARDQRVGHLWQGRYFSCAMDETHLTAAVRYVERNPVRAGLARSATDFAWSSAQPHCSMRSDPVLSPGLPLLDEVSDWARWLADEDDDVACLERLRACTRKGLPCGSDSFGRQVAERLGIPLERPPRGRPRRPINRV